MDKQKAYFAQFAGDRLQHFICENCGADFIAEQAPRDPRGRIVCCPHCVFNPLGCRCQYGEYGEAETRDWGDC